MTIASETATKTLDIGIDVDGICYVFTDGLRWYLHKYRGWSYADMPSVPDWCFFEAWGLSTEEFLQVCREGLDAGILFWYGDQYPDTAWALNHLHAQGHRLHYITDRSMGTHVEQAEAATRWWLHMNHLPVDRDGVTLTVSRDKTLRPVDIFIEDRPENYDALDAAGSYPWLFNRPWNTHRTDIARRVDTWRQFVDQVDRLSLELIA